MIRPGDMVMAVRGHPCQLGQTFVVAGVRVTKAYGRCSQCNSRIPATWRYVLERPNSEAVVPMEWCMKINPEPEIKSEPVPAVKSDILSYEAASWRPS